MSGDPRSGAGRRPRAVRPSASAIAPARLVAFTVLRRVFDDGAFADRALHAEATGLSPRDRALATALVYGTVQRRRTLDHVIGRFASRSPAQLDPPVLAALRLGALQLLYLDGITVYAAVNDSVELAKQAGPRGGAQLVNAVLRRLAREGRGIVAALSDATAADAAVLHSVPDWLAELWWAELGPDEARLALAAINRPAENALRVNTLRAAVPDVLAELPVAAEGRLAGDELPEGIVTGGPFDAFGSAAFTAGRLMPQSRASMLVARTLAPQPGERVLDLCAAPGGKTTHVAALMEGAGEVVAVEAHPGRARALRRTCELMGAESVRVIEGDGRTAAAGLGAFDRVLVDPPCSGLGTLQSRPDLRWQERRSEIGVLAARQAELLSAAAERVAPGGTLVYSVCTVSNAEGPGQIDAFLAGPPGPAFSLTSTRQLLPHRDGTDGFYIACLRRG